MSNSHENSFVIQKHSTPDGGHWDLMLQIENTLWTWRINHPPEHIQNTPITAQRIADHPLRFLTYEGSVQNYTASVKIADNGNFKITKQTDGEIEFEAIGKRLSGRFQLRLEQEDIWSLLRIG
jgi:bifunctional non-homologous end joining protein LigD